MKRKPDSYQVHRLPIGKQIWHTIGSLFGIGFVLFHLSFFYPWIVVLLQSAHIGGKLLGLILSLLYLSFLVAFPLQIYQVLTAHLITDEEGVTVRGHWLRGFVYWDELIGLHGEYIGKQWALFLIPAADVQLFNSRPNKLLSWFTPAQYKNRIPVNSFVRVPMQNQFSVSPGAEVNVKEFLNTPFGAEVEKYAPHLIDDLEAKAKPKKK